MIHNITEDGHFMWRCHHEECSPLSAHISHENIEWTAPDLVALPPCPCGSRCFIKVRFTEKELQAPNMKQYGMVPVQMEMPHALTGEMIPVMVPALKAIGDNPAIARHQMFNDLMEKHGRSYEAELAKKQAKEGEAANDSAKQ